MITGPHGRDDRPGNFEQATGQHVPPHCPSCGESRIIEQIGAVWHCFVCSTTWKAIPKA